MKVSIIIPVYNGEPFIDKAYEQLINQGLVDFEIIFIDNNSTDDSSNLLHQIQQRDPRVSVYFEKVQGAAAARNTGLSHAKGNYIYFFDIDDLLFENSLMALMETLDKNPNIMSVFGNTVKSKDYSLQAHFSENDVEIVIIQKPPYWGLVWMDYSKLPGTPSFMHRRVVFEKIGVFNTKLRLGEDAAFHIKLGLECTVAHIDKLVLLYYRHDASTVTKSNKKEPKVFTYWQPLVQEHIPYYLYNNAPVQFNKMVRRRAFGSIAKMLTHTKKFKVRAKLYKQLRNEISPLKIPFFLRPFLSIIVVSGSTWIYKFYFHYLVKPYTRWK